LDKDNDEKLEKLTKTVQKLLEGNPAILVGSGGSVPYGLPSMGDLASEIKSKLSNKYDSDVKWREFISQLETTNNLEIALETTTLDDDIHKDIIWTVWSLINEQDIASKNKFLLEQTSPVFLKILSKFIQLSGITNIVTTNYDRIIEYAACFANCKYQTGFSDGDIRIFQQFRSNNSKRMVNIFKVHGSIDWFKHNDTGILYSLPFFDIETLKNKYSPLIVTPGNSKYKETHLDPFRTVITKADDALRSSCAYLCIGYGFNDEHIQPIILDENRNKNKPIVIVTKEITPKIHELFIDRKVDNCLIISEEVKGGSKVMCSNSWKESYEENFWQLEEFYKLWFE